MPVSTLILPSHSHPHPSAPLRVQPALRSLSLVACGEERQSQQNLPLACQGHPGGHTSGRPPQTGLRLRLRFAESTMLVSLSSYPFPGYCCPFQPGFYLYAPHTHRSWFLEPDKAEQRMSSLAELIHGWTQWPFTNILNTKRPVTLKPCGVVVWLFG